MDERQIKAVLAAADQGSLAKAAAATFISTTGLKKQIDAAEHEVGCALFERTSKGLALTEAGRVFCAEAPALLLHTESVLSKVRAAAGSRTCLRLSVWPGKDIPVMDRICSVYRELNPAHPIAFVPTNAARYVLDVIDGTSDLGFFNEADACAHGAELVFHATGIFMAHVLLVAPGSPLLAKVGPLQPEDLVGEKVARATLTRDGIVNGRGWRIEFERELPLERYAVMSHCFAGGSVVCDEYFAATIPELAVVSLPWISSVEMLIGCKQDAPCEVLRFVEAARIVVAGQR